MNIDSSDNLGLRLKVERSRLGLSQAKVGEIMGKKANAVLNYEKGIRLVDHADLVALHQAGFDTWFLITGQRNNIVPLPQQEQDVLNLFHQVESSQHETLLTLMRNFAVSFPMK